MTQNVLMARETKTARVQSRVTQECRGLIDALMKKWGQTESSIIERAIREYAAKEGVQYTPLTTPSAHLKTRQSLLVDPPAPYQAGEQGTGEGKG